MVGLTFERFSRGLTENLWVFLGRDGVWFVRYKEGSDSRRESTLWPLWEGLGQIFDIVVFWEVDFDPELGVFRLHHEFEFVTFFLILLVVIR